MSDPIWAELYVPGDSLSRRSLLRLIDQLVALQLTDWDRLNRYTNYSQHATGSYDSFEGRTIEEAVDAFVSTPETVISLSLERPAMKKDDSDFWAEIYLSQSTDEVAHGLGGVAVVMSAGWSQSNRSWFPEFVALTRLLAELLDATYGWAAFQTKSESAPVTPASVAALELQPLEWVNIYGRDYVQKIGYERLRSMPPIASVEALANGGAMVTLGPTIRDVDRTKARTVAEHLGVPWYRTEWDRAWEELGRQPRQ